MSSVSDSALGMGGSDSKGSIRQPLVEQEVVPIGDSSSKDVPHKVSNNESSSF